MSALRAELVRRSLRAHAYAWVGLIPVFGMPFLVVSWINSFLCHRLQRMEWNPARRQLHVATALQILGVLQTLFLCSLVVARILNQLL